MLCESKALEVAVCGNGSWFRHTIESPLFTVSAPGVKLTASMTTVCVVGWGGSTAALGPKQQASAPSAAAREASARRLLAERRLDRLGMFQVRDERGPHLDQPVSYTHL